MNGYITFLVIFSFIALLTVVILLIINYFQEKKNRRDDTIALNFSSNVSGHFLGIEEEVKDGKGGRHLIKFAPKDIDVYKDDKQIESETIIIDKNKIETFPKGSVSPERNINVYFPRHASDLHESLKNTNLGRAIMWATELQNAVNAEVKSLVEGHHRKDEILNRLGHGEVSKEFLMFQDELFRDALRATLESRGKDKMTPTVLNPNALNQPRND